MFVRISGGVCHRALNPALFIRNGIDLQEKSAGDRTSYEVLFPVFLRVFAWNFVLDGQKLDSSEVFIWMFPFRHF